MDLGGGVVGDGSADILGEGNKGGGSREGDLLGVGGEDMSWEGQARGQGWLTAVHGGGGARGVLERGCSDENRLLGKHKARGLREKGRGLRVTSLRGSKGYTREIRGMRLRGMWE